MIEKLSPETPIDIERLGGKGCGLVRLLKAGFRVPDVWCISTNWNGEIASLRDPIEALLSSRQEPCAYAIRSSATAEDLQDASFAGVYTTTLGARSSSEILSAVEQCRASLQSSHARAYRESRGISHDVRMAILIQRLIEPEIAGVTLTANPQRAFANEWVIDAAYGLGEGVVSGRVDPDHLVVERDTGEIREQRIGSKQVALMARPGSDLAEVPVASADRERLCLTTTHLEALFRMAREIDEGISSRMDLEWAFAGDELYLLQARPITGLPSATPEDIWSRKFGDEYMADYSTPSGYTFLVRWIREYSFTQTARELGREDMLAMEPLRRFKGYVYLSGRYTLAGLRSLPVNSRVDAMRNWFPPSIEAQAGNEPFSFRELLANILRPFRDPRGGMKKNLAALDRHAERVMSALGTCLDEDLTTLSDSELGEKLERLDEIGLDHFRVIRWGMGQYAPMFHAALESTLQRWIGEGADELYQHLVSGLPETRTAEINRELWQLGITARTEPTLRRDVLANRPLDELRAEHSQSPFLASLDGFIARHGHRSTTRDVAEPRWRETPELVLALVRAQIASDTPAPDPKHREAASIRRRLEAVAEAESQLGTGILAAIRRRILRWLCKWTQLFTVYRENQRYYLDMILANQRTLIFEFGRRLEKARVLDEPWDAFLLEADELRACFASQVPSDSLRETIDERRRHYHRWKDRIPATYLYDDVETEGEVVEGDNALAGRSIDPNQGLGAARGVVTARLRVLADVRQLDQVEVGEVLVAENIDPGWTSVFPLLGGLVTETGGILSHGALLAREYGIPAVMGVRDATKRFETGMVVTLDGSTGRVEILDGEASC
jgi:pyruvate,water dikinase